jgi:hypothetical protein
MQKYNATLTKRGIVATRTIKKGNYVIPDSGVGKWRTNPRGNVIKNVSGDYIAAVKIKKNSLCILRGTSTPIAFSTLEPYYNNEKVLMSSTSSRISDNPVYDYPDYEYEDDEQGRPRFPRSLSYRKREPVNNREPLDRMRERVRVKEEEKERKEPSDIYDEMPPLERDPSIRYTDDRKIKPEPRHILRTAAEIALAGVAAYNVFRTGQHALNSGVGQSISGAVTSGGSSLVGAVRNGGSATARALGRFGSALQQAIQMGAPRQRLQRPGNWLYPIFDIPQRNYYDFGDHMSIGLQDFSGPLGEDYYQDLKVGAGESKNYGYLDAEYKLQQDDLDYKSVDQMLSDLDGVMNEPDADQIKQLLRDDEELDNLYPSDEDEGLGLGLPDDEDLFSSDLSISAEVHDEEYWEKKRAGESLSDSQPDAQPKSFLTMLPMDEEEEEEIDEDVPSLLVDKPNEDKPVSLSLSEIRQSHMNKLLELIKEKRPEQYENAKLLITEGTERLGWSPLRRNSPAQIPGSGLSLYTPPRANVESTQTPVANIPITTPSSANSRPSRIPIHTPLGRGVPQPSMDLAPAGRGLGRGRGAPRLSSDQQIVQANPNRDRTTPPSTRSKSRILHPLTSRFKRQGK